MANNRWNFLMKTLKESKIATSTVNIYSLILVEMPFYSVGDPLWVTDLEDPSLKGCFTGKCTGVSGDILKIARDSDNKQFTVDSNNPDAFGKISMEFPDNGYNDMVDLPELNQAELNRNLETRFKKDLCYCFTGPTLVAINLFKRVTGVFEVEIQDKYAGSDKIREDLPPHCYSVANDCVTNLIDNPRNLDGNERNQTIIITGESGSGKSFTTDKILKFVARLGGGGGEGSVADKVLAANPVLEAFGNAKMPRNDDSSRFGKLFRLLFDLKSRTIIGGDICPYLLEKSRISMQASHERNYHSFYMFAVGGGADPEFKKKYNVLDRTQYCYLNRHLKDPKYVVKLDQFGWQEHNGDTVCYEVWSLDPNGNRTEFRDDKILWEGLIKCFNACLLSPEQQDWIFRVLSGSLTCGNIKYIGDETSMDDAKLDPGSEALVATLAGIVMVDAAALRSALLTMTKDPKFGPSPLQTKKAVKYRDATGKTIYSEHFVWLIEIINETCLRVAESPYFVGVLDIFGFEYIAEPALQCPTFKNAFEQLCINFCNEKLQNHFVNYIFKLELSTYAEEGIDVTGMTYQDNTPTLELIEGKGGVLGLMDLQCAEGQGKEEEWDGQFLDKCKKGHAGTKKDAGHPSFEIPKPNKKWMDAFVVKHYAADVIYNVEEFIEKNGDNLTLDLYRVFMASTVTGPIASMFKKAYDDRYDADGGRIKPDKKNPVPATVAAKFKKSLDDLVFVLRSTTPSFVRCIKPNAPKKPNIWEGALVLKQLKYSGMLDTLKIRKIGYPDRTKFSEFYERFVCLAPTAKDCDALMPELYKLNPPDEEEAKYSTAIKKGKTRMFLRDFQTRYLLMIRKEVLGKAAVIVQSYIGFSKYNKSFQRLRRLFLGISPQMLAHVARARAQVAETSVKIHDSEADMTTYDEQKAMERGSEASSCVSMKTEETYSQTVADATAGERFGRTKESELLHAEDLMQMSFDSLKLYHKNENTYVTNLKEAQERWSKMESEGVASTVPLVRKYSKNIKFFTPDVNKEMKFNYTFTFKGSG